MRCSVTDCESQAKARGWCHRHYLRWWSAQNPDRIRSYSQRVYAGRDKTQRNNEWREANRDRVRALERERYAKQPEKFVAKATQWRLNNHDRHSANELARRARKREAFIEYVHPLVVLELGDGVCGICGEDVDPAAFEVDHIEPLSLGGEHSYGNTQPAHRRCNTRKGNRAA